MRVLIFGASGGIGAALAQEAVRQGARDVVTLSRSGGDFDLDDPSSLTRAVARQSGVFDRVVIATGQLAPPGLRPEKRMRDIDGAVMAQVMQVNAIGPAVILGALPAVLPKDRPAQIGVLSARVGSIGDNGLGGWVSYRASKAALNQVVKTAAIELARSHPLASCVALHPGTVETGFTAAYPRAPKQTAPEAAQALWRVMQALTPDHSGTFMDYRGNPIPW